MPLREKLEAAGFFIFMCLWFVFSTVVYYATFKYVNLSFSDFMDGKS